MGRHCSCPESTADEDALVFGADGELVVAPNRPVPLPPLFGPCPISTLNGSWLLQFVPKTIFSPNVRGPMRIEVGPSSLLVSGDIYTDRWFFPGVIDPARPPVLLPVPDAVPDTDDAGDGGDAVADESEDHLIFPFPPPWYPSFPKSQYSWYFRSDGATYVNGTLTVQIVRHLWNRVTQEFISTDRGTLVLTCRQSLITLPLRPVEMQGTLTIGGTVSTVKATKTSDFYRGCRVEVDAMVSRVFPASAIAGSGATVTFRSIYATAGWDVTVVTDEIDIPEDASLTVAELEQLLTTHRQAGSGEGWRVWLLLGSTQGTFFGLMFDDDAVPREGAVGFADATLGNDPRVAPAARNRPLDEVPTAFLRTLVHEAGHAFNLFHPKHDVHHPPIGTEIMNQTGDVIAQPSSTTMPYPANASLFFAEHDRTSLIHSPDPQVRPGWKNFGWGHGDLSAGLPAPVDVSGINAAADESGLALAITLPAQAYVGEYVTAEVTLTNNGESDRSVTSLLTLAEGDLVFVRSTPDGRLDHVLDVAVGCGPRPMVLLPPGQSVTSHVQVFFTNQGVTFLTPGRHTVAAQLEADAWTTVVSPPVTIDIRTAASEDEVAISAKTLTKGVGKAMALGDFGDDQAARAVLTDLSESHAGTDTGAAGALVMANSLARSFTDYRTDGRRAAAPKEAQHFLDLALEGRSAKRAAELAVTVASPVEKDAPVVADTIARLQRRPKPRARTAGASDLAEAQRIAEDFVSPQAR